MSDWSDRIYERVLIVRCQAGDDEAFREVVEAYDLRLRCYLRKLLGNMQTAEDALQDVWLDVYRGLPRLRNVEAFRRWIYRIAHDRACRLLRRARLRDLPEDFDQLAAEDDSHALTAETASQIHAALDDLSPEHREVLLLRFLEAMTYEEISHVIGVHAGTVKSRLHYAKKALRRAMDERDSHE